MGFAPYKLFNYKLLIIMIIFHFSFSITIFKKDSEEEGNLIEYNNLKVKCTYIEGPKKLDIYVYQQKK